MGRDWLSFQFPLSGSTPDSAEIFKIRFSPALQYGRPKALGRRSCASDERRIGAGPSSCKCCLGHPQKFLRRHRFSRPWMLWEASGAGPAAGQSPHKTAGRPARPSDCSRVASREKCAERFPRSRDGTSRGSKAFLPAAANGVDSISSPRPTELRPLGVAKPAWRRRTPASRRRRAMPATRVRAPRWCRGG